jgi:hypothetical protein
MACAGSMLPKLSYASINQNLGNVSKRLVPSIPKTKSAPNAWAGVSAPTSRSSSNLSTQRTPATAVNWYASLVSNHASTC